MEKKDEKLILDEDYEIIDDEVNETKSSFISRKQVSIDSSDVVENNIATTTTSINNNNNTKDLRNDLRKKNEHNNSVSIERNKRLLGNINGHLQIAKMAIETDAINFDKKRKENTLNALYDKKESIIESNKKFKQDLKELRNVLVTTVEPSIAWIPKEHNEISNNLLKLRNEKVNNTYYIILNNFINIFLIIVGFRFNNKRRKGQ
jgi:hypothetical protein